MALIVYLIYVTCWNVSEIMFHKIENSIDFRMKMDYFIEGEAPSYVTMLHMYAIIVLGGISLISTEVTIMLFVRHACGLFNVVW